MRKMLSTAANHLDDVMQRRRTPPYTLRYMTLYPGSAQKTLVHLDALFYFFFHWHCTLLFFVDGQAYISIWMQGAARHMAAEAW